MNSQSKESVQQSQRPTRQSQQRMSPHQQTSNGQAKTSQTKNAASNQDDADMQEKLKAMLTQVHRGESAPRVTGQYPHGLKTSSGGGSQSPSGGGHHHHGRNNRYTSNSVNNSNRQGHGQQNYGQILPRRQDFVFGRSQRPHGLLGPQPEHVRGRKTLVLDLDETLVHSQFNQVRNPDYTIPVDIEGRVSNIYVMKRPGAEYFLQQMAQYFEVVIYTASLSKYADPLMNMMDPQGYSGMRLFREHCTFVNGVFVKDMAQIGRNMKDAIIIDNSPTSYMLQPECGMPILSWYDDPQDRALFDYIPMLIEMSKINDMREAITGFVRNNTFSISYSMGVIAQIRDRENAEHLKRVEQERARKQHLIQIQQAQQQQKLQQEQQQILLKNQAQSPPQPNSETEADPIQVDPSSNKISNNTKISKTETPTVANVAVEPQLQNAVVAASRQDAPDAQQPVKSVNSKKKPLINSWFAKQQGKDGANRQVDPQQQQVQQAQTQEQQRSHLQQIQQQQQLQQQIRQRQAQQQQNNRSQEPRGQSQGAAQNQLMINTQQQPPTSETLQNHPSSSANSKAHKRNKTTYLSNQLQNQNGSAEKRASSKPNVTQKEAAGGSTALGTAANPNSASQQKVTNITNIIYNFNYGTQQAQASQLPKGATSPQQQSSIIPASNGQLSPPETKGHTTSSRSNQQIDQQKPRATKKSSGDGLQIKVNGDPSQAPKDKRATPTKQEQKSKRTGEDTNGTDEDNDMATGHKTKRPNTGSGGGSTSANQQFRQSFVKRSHQQAANPGSAAVLKSKDQSIGGGQGGQEGAGSGQRQYTMGQQSENQIGKVVKMSRKSTIDTKEANTGKMVVVLEKNRAGSQKKQEFAQNFSQNHGQGNQATQLQNKVLQVNSGAKNLKSKLKQSNNPFYAANGPKVLPIEIGNQRQLFNQIKTPQSALMGNMSFQKNQFLKQENRAIKAFTPSAAGTEMRYQNGEQPQSIFNFNQSPTAASNNSQSVMLTTPHGSNGLKNIQTKSATSPNNVVQQNAADRQGNVKRNVQQQKVRSFSQNQGSRKGISNILVYNQSSSMSQNQNAVPNGHHSRNQSSVLNTHQNQTNLQLQAHQMHQGSIQIGARSAQNANGQSQILYTESPQLETPGINNSLGNRGDKQNHSALVEKYQNFLGNKNQVKTPSGGDISLHHNQRGQSNSNQRVSQTNASQIISKLRNSQNQALNQVNKQNAASYPRNLLVIPQNAVNQAQPGAYIAMSPKTAQMQGHSRGGSRDKYGHKPSGSSPSGQQATRNQRVFMVNNGSTKVVSDSQKGSSEQMSSPKTNDGQIILPPSAHQMNFQMQVNSQGVHTKSSGGPHVKASPKHQNNASYITKHNPFKGSQVTVAQNQVHEHHHGGLQSAGMQQHAQYVNQPHHLMMPAHGQPGLSNIMAASAAQEKDDVLNLKNLYPQSQSPMSLKQMQNAKRQKRANTNLMANVGVNHNHHLVHIQQSAVAHNNRQTNNGSHMTNNQSPNLQFYATQGINNKRH